jgi:hypothetical protein
VNPQRPQDLEFHFCSRKIRSSRAFIAVAV